MLLFYLNMLMTLPLLWCLLLAINVIRLLNLWDNSRHGLKRTTCLGIRKNVKNVSSEVNAATLNTTPYLTFLNEVALFYCGGVTIHSDCKFRAHVNSQID